jgi:hypothetical protein
LAAAVSVTIPLPTPLVGVTVSHAALNTTVHAQLPSFVVTVTATVPVPSWTTVPVVGVTA